LRSNLYDVFVNIRDDELEHVKTMVACEDNSISVDIRVRAAGLAVCSLSCSCGAARLVCAVWELLLP